jgi:hypothetical protein
VRKVIRDVLILEMPIKNGVILVVNQVSITNFAQLPIADAVNLKSLPAKLRNQLVQRLL